MERLHLGHVLQTVCALEAVVLRSFGPEGGQVLFTRDTGQVMLSRGGARILAALRLEHPLARAVVECVAKHGAKTGDGSKTFILLLASLLRRIHGAACEEPNASRSCNSREAAGEFAAARRLADKLLAFALEKLDDLIAVQVAPRGCCLSWEDLTASTPSPAHANGGRAQELLASFFRTRLGRVHCDFVGELVRKLLSGWHLEGRPPLASLRFINDNFPALHTPVSGFPIGCSRLVEGQVIHRDFAAPCRRTDHRPVKAVAFTSRLQPKLLNAGDVLGLAGGGRLMEREGRTRKEGSVVQFSTWAERSLEGVFAELQKFGVSVLLCAVKQSAAVLSFAARAGMAVVECVSEDELCLFAQLSGASPVRDHWMIQPEHVATLTFCRPILLGAHSYVHVAFPDSEENVTVRPRSVVICGPGEGQTDQCACAFQDAIRMLLATWEPTYRAVSSEGTSRSHQIRSSHMDTQTDTAESPARGPPPSRMCVLEPGCVIAAGGTFEFLLHQVLLQHGRAHSFSNPPDAGIPLVSQLLANALLSVPRQIHSCRRGRFLQTQMRVLGSGQNPSRPVSFAHKQVLNKSPIYCCGKSKCPLEDNEASMYCYRKDDGGASDVFMLDPGLESVSCKYQLVLAVVQCVTSLLRADTVLHTHTGTHTHRHTPAKDFGETSEDEG